MDSQAKQLHEFWVQFEEALQRIREQDTNSFSEQGEQMLNTYRKRLQEIDSNLTVNVERSDPEGRMQLVFGCDGYPESIHNVLSLVNAAPSINGIAIKAFNERMDPVPSRVDLAGELCEISDYWCSLRVLGGQLELAIYMEDAPEVLDLEPRVEAVMIFLDALLGEYEIMTRIWALDWFELPVDPLDYGLIPLAQLRGLFDQMKQDVKPIGIELH